ncbi:unnamed protein product [Cyclocybe aegerita]|uniref:GH16 domain-containing protein n=1 Tax=Cyclocybe aegerita TaxID=1973307 RepID=A0A8S0Y079_CYCAE|nr:unnamed protein product [Cyclocybe aegerita]
MYVYCPIPADVLTKGRLLENIYIPLVGRVCVPRLRDSSLVAAPSSSSSPPTSSPPSSAIPSFYPAMATSSHWNSRHSHPNPSHPSASGAPGPTSSASGISSNSSGSREEAQYIEYGSSDALHGLRSPPPQTPNPLEDARLLSQPSSPVPNDVHGVGQRQLRSVPGSSSFPSSPLNPTPPSTFSAGSNPFARPTGSRPASRGSSKQPQLDDNLMAGLGLGNNSSGLPHSIGPRGSMILYRLADDGKEARESLLMPPKLFRDKRDSIASSSGDSMISISSDSKYPSGMPSVRGLVPYAYDPILDENEAPDDEDLLHDPNRKGGMRGDKGAFPWRGIMNVGVIIVLLLALLCLFIFYPVLSFYRDEAKNRAIDGNIRINATGQAPVLFQMPEVIDPETPPSAMTRTGFDGQEYELVFSDEFNTDGRTFYPGDDPFWEAVDLWYGATGDLEWYDPSQVTTRDGALVITMDSTSTAQAGLTPGSTAPFTAAENHNMEYRSGMLQTWNKFCFTTGYIEVAASFPGPDQSTTGYWPGAWTMGNLARPGYPATTDGMWPYTYDSCDVGTFPNQTNKDGLGPAAALHSDASRSRYNFELSWLSGQRLSACSCPGSDHPGPDVTRGRGAPELDIFEAEKDKDIPLVHIVSQSAQFAPFSHDYTYNNNTGDWINYDSTRTRANTYRGSAVQQSVSGLTRVPADMFQGSGANFKTFGFEYWSDPNDRQAGYVNWQVDGARSHRVSATAVGPDQGSDGSGVGQRLIPEEPMAIVLNLGISSNWQTIDLSSMMFPAELKFDYVRVYQRKGQTNVGCNPKDYPTTEYINNHMKAYTDINMTTWDWPKPRNSLYEGSC